MKTVNLGCPIYCDKYVCVDAEPEDMRVIKADSIEYLSRFSNQLESIYSKNMLEHLTEIDQFYSNAYKALAKNGIMTVITDNAEFFPFYLPFVHRFGFGAHSSNRYFNNYKYRHCSFHYMIFTKLHLMNLATRYGFKILECKRITFGARLKCSMQKI